MTKEEAIDAIKIRLGNREHLKTNGTIAAELALQQSQLEARPFLPNFLQYYDEFVPVDSRRVTVPEGFIREMEDGRLVILVNGIETSVEKEDFDVLRTKYQGATAATPEFYALVGTEMFFFPTPDKTYVGIWQYYKSDVAIGDLEDDETNQWLTKAPQYLVARTAKTIAMTLQNPQLVAVLDAQEKEAFADLQGFTVAGEVAARSMRMRD